MRSLVPVGIAALVCTAGLAAQAGTRNPDAAWTRAFAAEPGELASTGRNPYVALEPGATLTLSAGRRRHRPRARWLAETHRSRGVLDAQLP